MDYADKHWYARASSGDTELVSTTYADSAGNVRECQLKFKDYRAWYSQNKPIVRGETGVWQSGTVDPLSLGLGLQAFVAAELIHHSTDCIETFECGIVAVKDVRACYHVAGRFDYLLHVAVRDLEHLGRLIKHDIAAIPGVDKVETMLVFSEVKPDEGWPASVEDEEA